MLTQCLGKPSGDAARDECETATDQCLIDCASKAANYCSFPLSLSTSRGQRRGTFNMLFYALGSGGIHQLQSIRGPQTF